MESLISRWNLRWNLLVYLTAALTFSPAPLSVGSAHAETNDEYRLSDPVVHDNLAIYFVRGQSRPGPVPLTLAEALTQKSVEVREKGEVNALQIENTGSEEVFIQAGDIVKGGQQDRVLSVSLLLRPHSGPLDITAFCVEQGRWSARGGEDVKKFSTASASLPSRTAKFELAGAGQAQSGGAEAASVGKRQAEIWNTVTAIQGKLSRRLGAPVAAAPSRTSLQLALENGSLARAQAEYVNALQAAGEKDDDIIGYVFAINGKINSADIYPSNGLFRKMWPKLLRASATEALGDRSAGTAPAAPPAADALSFIATPRDATATEKRATPQGRVELHENATTLFLEAKPASAPDSAWVHRSYLAK
jgi:hypothetical protein